MKNIDNKPNVAVEVRDLLIEFGSGRKKVKAVKGVTFDVFEGETFGLVGESGSGKTTVGRAIMGIQPVSDGTVYFNNDVAYGKSPKIGSLNKSILKNLEMMILNQDTTSLKLHKYSQEFKRVYYKYVESKFYDFKTNEIREYEDGKDHRIPEGKNLKDTKLVNVKKDVNIKYLSDAISDNLIKILKIIRINEKAIRFLERVFKYVELPEEHQNTLERFQMEAYQEILEIKDKENAIYKSLEKMTNTRKDVLSGKYTSVSKFFDDLGNELEEIIKLHKEISSLVARAISKQKYNVALTVPKSEKKEWIKNINDKKSRHFENEEIITKCDLVISTLQEIDIDLLINKCKNFKSPNKKEKYDLKRQMQMIFQDPASSLNDRMAVEEIIGEGLSNFPKLYKNKDTKQLYIDWFNENTKGKQIKNIKKVKNKDVKRFLILQLLVTVGMLPEHLSRYPHEFSGGQRQRIGIARALVMRPSFIVADEPISALDVSIRAQVMNLLSKFQKEFNLTYIFIAHDLSVVKFVANRIAVIYRGDIVELAESNELFNNPIHPYTKSLLSAVPLPDPEQEKNKIHYKYVPEEEHFDYIVDFPKWREINNGHFVYCNDREFEKYKNK